MRTGMEYPLIGVVVIVGLVVLWNMWSSMQLDYSVASLNATIAGQAAPEPVMIAGEWIVKAIVGTIIGGFVTTGAIWLIGWARRNWRKWSLRSGDQSGNSWRSGPNAQWERQPRPVSEAELMRMALMRSLASQGQAPPRLQISREGAADDEPQINL